jgi:hypothetical protein
MALSKNEVADALMKLAADIREPIIPPKQLPLADVWSKGTVIAASYQQVHSGATVTGPIPVEANAMTLPASALAADPDSVTVILTFTLPLR